VLNVTLQNSGDMVILGCEGRIVRGQETAILCAAIQQHGQDIVLDLSGVSAIDAAGIGLLVSLQAAGVYIKLMNPTEPVREVLRLTNVDSVFEICESEVLDERIERGVA
jgi:anti-anti-sigma factor